MLFIDTIYFVKNNLDRVKLNDLLGNNSKSNLQDIRFYRLDQW